MLVLEELNKAGLPGKQEHCAPVPLRTVLMNLRGFLDFHRMGGPGVKTSRSSDACAHHAVAPPASACSIAATILRVAKCVTQTTGEGKALETG